MFIRLEIESKTAELKGISTVCYECSRISSVRSSFRLYLLSILCLAALSCIYLMCPAEAELMNTDWVHTHTCVSAPDSQHGVDLPDEVSELVHNHLQLLVLLFEFLINFQYFSSLFAGCTHLIGHSVIQFRTVILYIGYKLLRRDGVQTSTIFIAFVIDKTELSEKNREHPQVLLQFPQPVLVSVGMIGDSIRQLHVSQQLKDLHGS